MCGWQIKLCDPLLTCAIPHCFRCGFLMINNTTTTTTFLRPFVGDYYWVSQYQKKHSPAHQPDHRPIFISQLCPSTMIRSILPFQITYLAIFLHNIVSVAQIYIYFTYFIWRIWLNRLRAAVMRPYLKLVGPLVVIIIMQVPDRGESSSSRQLDLDGRSWWAGRQDVDHHWSHRQRWRKWLSLCVSQPTFDYC